MRFDELDLEEAVLDGLDAMNFQETTPVQELTIPVILSPVHKPAQERRRHMYCL